MKRSLEGVEGVIEAEVSFKQAKAWVKVRDIVTDEMLVEAVRATDRFRGKVIGRESGDAGVNHRTR